MAHIHRTLLSSFALWCCSLGWTQTPGSPAVKREQLSSASPRAQLTIIKSVRLTSAEANTLYSPKCDSDGNIYFANDVDPQSGIQKINPKGETVAVFRASSVPDLQPEVAARFWIGSNGEVYQYVQAREVGTQKYGDYLFVYGSDGSYKSRIKPDKGHIWRGDHVAIFPSGNLLIAGQKYDDDRSAPKIPSTIIFSSDGTPLKEVMIDGDEELRRLAASGDSHVASSLPHDNNNRAVDRGSMEVAEDGNAYLMRNLPSPVVYVISPGGELIRHFTINPGGTDFSNFGGLHVSGNRIAIYFYNEGSKIVKVVDLEGREIQAYDKPRSDEKMTIGMLACYQTNPERLTFFGYQDDKTFLVSAEPK